MNVQDGTFLHWPLGGDWELNQPVLQLMSATRKAWHFFATAKERSKRKFWTNEEIEYDEWLNEGRIIIPQLSESERWQLDMGYLSPSSGVTPLQGDATDE